LPRTDLSELFPVPAVRYLATRRGRLRNGDTIEAIHPVADALGGGLRLQGDPAGKPWHQVVIATAPYHAAPLLASTGLCDELATAIDRLPHEPIVTVYLGLGPGQRLEHPMIGLTDGPAQWAFDRGQLGGPEGLLACVISAHGEHEALSREALVDATRAQLERQLGRALPVPEWSQVITEKRATIACRPDVFRPGIRTPVPGLWLAGDYLASDYPATLESAVRSGVACAQAILAQLPAR
ncbi:MAG: phytoene dehydrogenase, partial [Thauera phenolivorans]|nr:phytoene dehydrogenase [Thauera phenolivorans]